MPGGRPTKYTPELLKFSKEYPYNFSKYGHSFPSVVGLCKELKITSETVYSWARDPEKQEFSDIVKQIMDMQHYELAEGGINGSFNPTISKLILAKHGHSDKAEVTQDVNAKHEVQVSAVDSFASILSEYKKD